MADNVQVQGIEFEIISNSDKATKSLDSLAKALSRIRLMSGSGLGLNRIASELSSFQAQLSKLNLDSATNSIKGVASAIRSLNQTRVGSSSAGGVSEFTKSFGKASTAAKEAQNSAENAFENTKQEAEETAEKLENLREAADRTANSLSMEDVLSKSKYDLVSDKIEMLRQRLSEAAAAGKQFESTNLGLQIKSLEEQQGKLANSNLTSVFKNIASGATKAYQAIRKVASVAAQAFSHIVRLAKQIGGTLASGAAKAATSLGKMSAYIVATPFKAMASRVSELAKKFKTLTSSLARIALYRALRSIIKNITSSLKEGIENLYYYSKALDTVFHSSMDTYATDILYLKNAFASMAAPIINVVIPAFDALTDKIVSAFNAVARFFAAITGQSVYSQAKKKVTEYGDALDSAKKKQKELTIGLDELNILSQNDNDLSDYEDMFEEVEVPNNLKDFSDSIQQAIENGSWEEVGRLIADKINGIFDNIPWREIGAKLGEWINILIRTAYSLLDSLNFEDLGHNIADMLTSGINQVNFDTAGRLFAEKITSMVDLLFGFVDGLAEKSEMIGRKIGEFVNGAIEEAQEWIDPERFHKFGSDLGQLFQDIIDEVYKVLESHDFGKLGEAVAEAINGFFEKVDFHEAGQLITKAITIVFDEIIAFIETLEWSKIGEKIGDFIDGAFSKAHEWIKEQPWKDMGTKIAGFINSLVEKVNKTLDENRGALGEALGEFVMGIVSNVHWDEVGALLVNAITWVIDQFIAFILALDPVEVGMAFADFVNGAFDKLRDWLDSDKFAEAADNLKTMFLTAVKNIDWGENLDTFFGMIVDIINWIIDAIAGVPDETWQEIGESIGRAIGNIGWVKAFVTVGNAIWQALKGIIAGLFDSENGKVVLAIAAGILAIKGLFKVAEIASVVSKFVKAITGASGLGSIAGVLSGIVSKIGTALAPLASVIFSPQGAIAVAVIAIAALIIANWDDIKEAAGKLWEKLKDVWGKIKDAAIDLKEKASEAWNGLKQSLSDTWDNLKEGAENLKNSWSDKWEEIKQGARDLKDGAAEAFDGLKEKAAQLQEGLAKSWEDVKQSISDLKNSISEKFAEIGEGISGTLSGIKEKAVEAAEAIKNKAGEAFSSLRDKAKGLWDNLTDGESIMDKIKNAAGDMAESITGSIVRMSGTLRDNETDITDSLGNISSEAANAISSTSSAMKTIKDALTKVASKITTNFTTKTSKKSSIKGYASGGFPTSGQLFFARENGMTEYVGSMNGHAAVANDEQIVAGIKGGVAEGMAPQASLMAQLVDIANQLLEKDSSVRIGDDVIGRSNDRYTTNRGRRVSRGAFANAY